MGCDLAMYVPVIKKVIDCRDVFIERSLFVPGTIYSHVGDEVKPFDHLGECTVSHSVQLFPANFRPYKLGKEKKKFYHLGAKIGNAGSKTINALYNGQLVLEDTGGYKFLESEGKYTLLAGVWGKVEKIIPGKAVLLRTQTRDIHFAATTKVSFSGELLVFPNPSQILEKYYLNEFSRGIGGEIIYAGHTVDIEVLKEASRIGIGGIVAGSAHKDVFTFAKKNNMCFGVICGFGEISTPQVIYDFMAQVANRYVFFQGERNVLRIPVPEPVGKKAVVRPLRSVKKGTVVEVFQKPHFGEIGEVDRITESSIFVKFGKNSEAVEVDLPNFYVLE